MKHTLYILLLSCLSLTSLKANTPMREWFITMPDSIMPLLTKNNRLDFIDFIDSRMDAVVTNRLDGKSHMTQLTDDYLHIQYTKVNDITMKLLPVTDTTHVLCMVTTMNTSVRDSRIAFFAEGWKPMSTITHFAEPQKSCFITVEQNDSTRHTLQKLDIHFKTYTLSPKDNTLTCRLTTLDYLNNSDREAVKPHIREKLIYRWDGMKFVTE